MGAGRNKRAGTRTAVLEAMEKRTLMSTTWTTADDFADAPGQESGAFDVATDAEGNTYVAGFSTDGNGANRGTVRRRAAGAADWTTSVYNFSAGGTTTFRDLAVVEWTDAAGAPHKDLYAVGQGKEAGAANGWWVAAKSSDDGATWTTVDQYKLAGSTQPATPMEVTSDAAGNLYVAGYAKDESLIAASQGRYIDHWVVRKSTDHGQTWTTVDDFALQSGYRAAAQDMIVTASGVFVVGRGDVSAKGGGVSQHWVVRKSNNGGASWGTVENFQYGGSAWANGISADPQGNLYVAGYGINKNRGYWVVRKAGATGTTWASVDAWQLSSSYRGGWAPEALGVAAGAGGSVYVTGRAPADDGTLRFITRNTTNGGSTWQTSDNYALSTGYNVQNVGYGVAVDRWGSVIVAGLSTSQLVSGSTTSFLRHWTVRELKSETAPTTPVQQPVFSDVRATADAESDPITDQILA